MATLETGANYGQVPSSTTSLIAGWFTHVASWVLLSPPSRIASWAQSFGTQEESLSRFLIGQSVNANINLSTSPLVPPKVEHATRLDGRFFQSVDQAAHGLEVWMCWSSFELGIVLCYSTPLKRLVVKVGQISPTMFGMSQLTLRVRRINRVRFLRRI
jgi:hypothetical protein